MRRAGVSVSDALAANSAAAATAASGAALAVRSVWKAQLQMLSVFCEQYENCARQPRCARQHCSGGRPCLLRQQQPRDAQ